MKKMIALGCFAAFLAAGCGDDKKTVIATKLDNELPKVAGTAGGGGAPAGGTSKGKVKGPGGGAVAD